MAYEDLARTSFFPFWAYVARRIVLKMITPPADLDLLESVSEGPSLYDTLAGLASHQPAAFRVLLSLCIFLGLLVPCGAAVMVLRFMGMCGSKRIQEISPTYTEIYNTHFVALSCLTVTFMVLNVMLVGFGTGIDRSLHQASAFYDHNFHVLATRIPPWKGNQEMPNGLRKEFEAYFAKKMNHSLLQDCAEEGGDLKNCSALDRMWNSGQLRQRIRAQVRSMIRKLKRSIAPFQKRRGAIFPPLMNVLAVVVGLTALLYMVALTVGMRNHDKGMAPTERNVKSHLAGLVMLYNPLFMFLAAVTAVPLAIFLLVACIVGECYFCDGRKLLAGELVATSCNAGDRLRIASENALHSAFAAFAKESSCLQLYHMTNKGTTFLCGSVLPSYHGGWLTLLSVAVLLVAAVPVSLRMSKFYLVMDQYRYVGWDDQLIRKPLRRRQMRGRRVSF